MTTSAVEILDHIDPSQLDYQEWLSVGMALKHEGVPCSEWDAWSRRDHRYRDGDCFKRWNGFRGSDMPVTAGTIIEMARRQGWTPLRREHTGLEWDSEIGGRGDDLRIVDTAWIEDAEIVDPGDTWDPVSELTTYLSTLFETNDHVGYVVDSYRRTNKNGEVKMLPGSKGGYSRTAGQLIQELATCGGDIGKVFGDSDADAGAWIRFNPLDGHGVNNDNVTSYRYALVESDEIPIEKQAAIYREMELPVAALINSGKKSLHAIVRINATSKEQYRERVNFLYQVCKQNGLIVDEANKNPSRLSRMPGVMRAGQKQHLVAINQGKANWEEWKNFVEEANDNLPDFECLNDMFHNLPQLADPLIDGVLREGHKMLLAGPSKAGKSYILLQLVIAIAEGRDWLGWPCSRGRVLYINLELDRASCLHRLKSLYAAHSITPANLTNIDIWHLRGKAVPMDALAPKLIRRALKKRYKAVIIDPIYKVITGDENAADKMAHFCNQFDRLCSELGSAVIYCHHHSKGQQGQKASRDRSSGSGVFARDPDAIVDLIELDLGKQMKQQIRNRFICDAVSKWLDAAHPDWRVAISQDTALVANELIDDAKRLVVPAEQHDALAGIVERAEAVVANQSAWRMEGTLREFPPFDARRFFFRHPIHVADVDGILADARAEGEEIRREPRTADEPKKTPKDRLLGAYEMVRSFGESEDVRPGDIAETAGVNIKTVRQWMKDTSAIELCDDGVCRKPDDAKNYELDCAIAAAADITGRVRMDAVAAALKCTPTTVRNRVNRHGGWEIKTGNIVKREETK